MKKKSKKTLIVAIIAVLIVVIAGAIFLLSTGRITVDSLDSGIPVSTPYGELYFSDEWAPYFDSKADENDNYTVNFIAKYEDAECELFSIVFGGESDGALIGTIEGDNVYILMNEIVIPEGLPEEKINAFYGMQEEVNRIIPQIESFEGFAMAE